MLSNKRKGIEMSAALGKCKYEFNFSYRETEKDWELDYRNDVLEEVTKLGIVVHISVDTISQEVAKLVFSSYLKCFTHFWPMFPFYNHLIPTESLWFAGVFRE